MTHLYAALAWTIDEPARPREYVFHDNGEVLANVTRVAVPRADDPAMPYGNPHAAYDETRIVVCVAGPDGTPYFYLDRMPGTTGPTPASVRAPNGGFIGSFGAAKGSLKGIVKLMQGKGGSGFVLRDGSGIQIAQMTGVTAGNPQGTITDANGAPIAWYSTVLSPYAGHRRRHTMRIDHRLPEPLHTLVLASLIGMEIMTPVL